MNQSTRQYESLVKTHGSPLFVYDSGALNQAAEDLIDADMPYGLTVRYAAKANPHPGVIQLFDDLGLHFDASSTYEAKDLMNEWVEPRRISLSAQSLRGPLKEVLELGVLPVATSLHQIDVLAEAGAKTIALRVNPGMGSGGNKRTTVGGPASGFGIWHEYVSTALSAATARGMVINRLHTHIGSGADPAIWREAIQASLRVVEELPDVTTLDIGGGYKVARMPGEQATDMPSVLGIFAEELERFNDKTGRQLHLEIEPGTYLVANAGTLIARVEDIVDTGTEGYTFLRLDTGMNDILRPSLYGAQHPITVLNRSKEQRDYVVVGHNCESGDILTPAPGDPESLLPRTLKKARIGDLVAIGGVGAYCASMRARGYNAFPDAGEILV